jgi:hypothetical protein
LARPTVIAGVEARGGSLLVHPLRTDPRGSIVAGDGTVSTYRLGITYTAAQSFADAWQFRNSRAGVVSRIKRIRIDGALAAAQQIAISLYKRSTPTTGSIASTTNGVSMDSMDSPNLPSAGVVDQWTTVKPASPGMPVGIIGQAFPVFPSTTPATPGPDLLWEFGGSGRKPLIVRGTSEAVAVSFQSTIGAFGSGMITIEAEWTEGPQ